MTKCKKCGGCMIGGGCFRTLEEDLCETCHAKEFPTKESWERYIIENYLSIDSVILGGITYNEFTDVYKLDNATLKKLSDTILYFDDNEIYWVEVE